MSEPCTLRVTADAVVALIKVLKRDCLKSCCVVCNVTCRACPGNSGKC